MTESETYHFKQNPSGEIYGIEGYILWIDRELQGRVSLYSVDARRSDKTIRFNEAGRLTEASELNEIRQLTQADKEVKRELEKMIVGAIIESAKKEPLPRSIAEHPAIAKYRVSSRKPKN
jgi:hypothetical protein